MLSDMKVMQLRKYAREHDIDLGDATSKTAIIKKIEAYENPVVPDKIALYFDHPLYHPILGRIEKGYHAFDNATADLWLKTVGNRVRVATPQEVAAFYGV